MPEHRIGEFIWFRCQRYRVVDAWNPPGENEMGWVKLEEVQGERGESVLSQRIAEGKADPIREEEREIAASLRDFFEERDGKE